MKQPEQKSPLLVMTIRVYMDLEAPLGCKECCDFAETRQGEEDIPKD